MLLLPAEKLQEIIARTWRRSPSMVLAVGAASAALGVLIVASKRWRIPSR